MALAEGGMCWYFWHKFDQYQPSSYFFLHTDMHSPLDSIPHIFGRMHAPVHRRTCFQHICTHTRSHAPSIPQQTFCCFLCLSLLVVKKKISTIEKFWASGLCGVVVLLKITYYWIYVLLRNGKTGFEQSEKFLDLGTRTWRGADV